MDVDIVCMKSVDKDEISAQPQELEFKIGVIFEDSETPRYNHSVVWRFEPTLRTGSQDPILTVSSLIHKKYYREIDANITSSRTDDGSNLVNTGDWYDKPIDTSVIPETVRNKFESIFGETLATNTFEKPEDVLDTEVTEIDIPEIPDDHYVIVPEINIKYKGSYTERVESDNPQERFKTEFENEDGDTVSYYSIDHLVFWNFKPKPSETGLEVLECFHKIWDDSVRFGFDVKEDGVDMLETHRKVSGTPSNSELPKSLLAELCNDFGEQFVRTLLDDPEDNLPQYVYECVGCDSACVVTPRDNCPNCGSSSTIRYESEEEYINHIENETERDRDMKEFVANAEVSIGMD